MWRDFLGISKQNENFYLRTSVFARGCGCVRVGGGVRVCMRVCMRVRASALVPFVSLFIHIVKESVTF